MAATEGYSIVRPVEYNVGRYVKTLTESCVNIYHQQVEPLDFDHNRCSFQFKSPGLNSLCSSALFVEFDIEIGSPSKRFDFQAAILPNIAIVQTTGDGTAAHTLAGATPTITFGEGNVFAAAQTSYQVVINGASLQQNRMDEWKTTVDKLFYPSVVMQRRFGRCGGAWNAYDSVAVSGNSFAAAGTSNTAHCVAGFTQDSGIAKRIRGLLACTKQIPTVAGQIYTRTIRVRAPLEGCGLFNPLGRGDRTSPQCPMNAGSYCLPHCNVIQINILFRNLFKTLVRNLSCRFDEAGGGNIDQGGGTNLVTVTFPGDGPKAKLCVDYIRLLAWRNIPATRHLPVYRVAVHDPTSGKAIVGGQLCPALCLDGANAVDALRPCGVDPVAAGVGAVFSGASYIEPEWSGLTMSQIPTYLAFLYQKSTDMYTLAGSHNAAQWDFTGAAGVPADAQSQGSGLGNQLIARNTTASACPVACDLMIQSSIGSYRYSSEGFPYLKGRSELFRDTLKNAYLDYCDGCEFKWSKHNGMIFLASQDYARGLGSEGSSMPVVFNAKVKFVNMRQFADGTGATYLAANSRGSGVIQDIFMSGKPLLLAWFKRMSIELSPSSAGVKSQNISHASATQLLGQTQQPTAGWTSRPMARAR